MFGNPNEDTFGNECRAMEFRWDEHNIREAIHEEFEDIFWEAWDLDI